MLQNQDDDEDDIEYSEIESNNPDGDNDQNDVDEGDEGDEGDGEVVTRTMPNENTTDATTSRDARLDGTQNTSDNHNTTVHHMKNSPSDEEFYGGPATGSGFL